jgi:AAA ATPase domain
MGMTVPSGLLRAAQAVGLAVLPTQLPLGHPDRLISQDLIVRLYVPWLAVGYEARTSNAAGTLCPVMVGRDRELAELQQAWRAGGQMLVVGGRAGIGKSRLVRELADWARSGGGTVLAGRCSATAGDVPFRALREALLAAARVGLAPSPRLAAFRPALGSLVPEWSGEHAGGVDGGLIVLAEGVLRLMVEWSSPDAAALLVIEDLHWADRETLEVLEYLADHLHGHAALVVVTLRDDEPGPGGELLSALWARRAVQPIVEGTGPCGHEELDARIAGALPGVRGQPLPAGGTRYHGQNPPAAQCRRTSRDAGFPAYAGSGRPPLPLTVWPVRPHRARC